FKEFTINDKLYKVRMSSLRYTLYQISQQCVICGLVGKRMFLQAHDEEIIFGLYGEEHGQLVMLNKDHIISVRLGGSSDIENLQLMCSICNNLKSHYLFNNEQVKSLRKIYDDNFCVLGAKPTFELIQIERARLQNNRIMAKKIKSRPVPPSINFIPEPTLYFVYN